MSTISAFALGILALTAPGWTKQVAPPTTGHVLVLDNERTLEGDIERHGTQYRLRRSAGELLIPSENVLRLCATREEAYAFLRSRANLIDPDEHLRLARWCQSQGLRRQALAEAAVAVELRPNHAESQRFLRSLQSLAAKPDKSRGTRNQDDPEGNAPAPEVNSQSLSLFITKVQPILMNGCASCHATGRGGSFKLVRVYDDGHATRKTTQQNLAAVLAMMNKEHAQSNQLLAKSLTIHGDMAQPVFKNKDSQAYRTLEEWTRLTTPLPPPVREVVSLPPGPPPATDHVAPAEPAKESDFHAEKEVGAPATEPAEGAPLDPYDPAIFNRQNQPKNKKAKH